MDGCVNGQAMDRWINEWIDLWMDGLIDRGTGGQTDKTVRWKDRWID